MGPASSRSKALVLLHGILKRAKKVWGLQVNTAAEVEKPALKRSGDIQVFSPEEVRSLVRAAASEQDATNAIAGRAPSRMSPMATGR